MARPTPTAKRPSRNARVVRTTVSIDEEIYRLAKRRMRALGIRKFSQYVALLLEKDYRQRGPLVLIRDEKTGGEGAMKS